MNNLEKRYAEGRFDPEFGEDGVVRWVKSDIDWFGLSATAILLNKKMVAVISNGDNSFSVARINENGTLDAGFGREGYRKYFLRERHFVNVNSVSLVGEDGWLIFGSAYNPDANEQLLFVVRQDAEGNFVPGFGTEGVRYIDRNDVRLPEDEREVVGIMPLSDSHDNGNSLQESPNACPAAINQQNGLIYLGAAIMYNDLSSQAAVLSLNADGSTNTEFGGGRVLLNPANIIHANSNARQVVLQKDGKVLVSAAYNIEKKYSNFLMRLNSNGESDPGFNQGKAIDIDFTDALSNVIHVSIHEGDGRIVAVGDVQSTKYSPDPQVPKALVIVLNSSGSFNQIFNKGKPLIDGFSKAGIILTRCAFQDNGSIIVAGRGGPQFIDTSTVAIVARYLPTGVFDEKFGRGSFVPFRKGDDEGEALVDMNLSDDGRITICGRYVLEKSAWMVRYI